MKVFISEKVIQTTKTCGANIEKITYNGVHTPIAFVRIYC